MESVVPEVEAPEGSVWFKLVGAGGVCLALVPEVDGVGDECGEFDQVQPLEFVSAGNAGAGGNTGGAAGGVGA